MIIIMQKPASVFLAICLAISMMSVGFLPASAWSSEEIAALNAAIEEYNNTHGGTGKLFVEFSGDKQNYAGVVITGEVTGATKGLSVSYVVDWRARISGTSTGGEALLRAL